MSTQGWDGILDDGENILWQGTPVRGMDWSKLVDFQTLFGLFFTGFALFWMNMAGGIIDGFRNPPPFAAIFPLFGLIFVGVGLNMVIGRHIWAAFKRNGTHYTLTNKAAYIATQPMGQRKLKRVGFDEMVPVTLNDGSPGDVHFAERLVTYSRNRSNSVSFGTSSRTTTTRVPVGFERIEDARAVYRLLRDARGDN